jgi:hypothetical protein
MLTRDQPYYDLSADYFTDRLNPGTKPAKPADSSTNSTTWATQRTSNPSRPADLNPHGTV